MGELERLIQDEKDRGVLHSSGIFTLDLERAKLLLSTPGYLPRAVLLIVQGMVALSGATQRSVPGRLNLVYTESYLSITLEESSHEPDWEALGGELERLVLAAGDRPCSYLARGIMAFLQLHPLKLTLSGGGGSLAWAGPRPPSSRRRLALRLELSKEGPNLKALLDDTRGEWVRRLRYCPLPVLIQGKMPLKPSQVPFLPNYPDLIEVMELAAADEAGVGGRFFGPAAQHLGPYAHTWLRSNFVQPPVPDAVDSSDDLDDWVNLSNPSIRLVLASPGHEPLQRRRLPRAKAILQVRGSDWDTGRAAGHCQVVAVRHGVTLERPLSFEVPAHEPESQLVVVADHQKGDLDGELVHDSEHLHWMNELAQVRRHLLVQGAGGLAPVKQGEDGRSKSWFSRRFSNSQLLGLGALATACAGIAIVNATSIPLTGMFVASRILLEPREAQLGREWRQVLRRSWVQSVREPVAGAVNCPEFVRLLVGWLAELGGRQIRATRGGLTCRGLLRLTLVQPAEFDLQSDLSLEESSCHLAFLLALALQFRPGSVTSIRLGRVGSKALLAESRILHGDPLMPLKAPPGQASQGDLVLDLEGSFPRRYDDENEFTIPLERPTPYRYRYTEEWGQELQRRGVSAMVLQRCRQEADKEGGSFLPYLMEQANLSERDALEALAHSLRVPFLDLENQALDIELVQAIPPHLGLRYAAMPVCQKDNRLLLALADPLNLNALDDIHLMTGFDLEVALSSHRAILACWANHCTQHDVGASPGYGAPRSDPSYSTQARMALLRLTERGSVEN